jgi:EAL domain-containing protein (putative c-di-GMP-specific phosphodiesterase class I)/GGDEF domain-containing protein
MKQKDFGWMGMKNEEFLEQLLQLMIQKDIAATLLETQGEQIYTNSITFSQLSILLDTFSYTLSLDEKKILQTNENILAKGYLKKRLPQEIKLLKIGIHNNPNLITQKDLSIIDELLVWLEKLVEHIIHQEELPDISQRIEPFIKYINEKAGVYFDDPDVKENFLNTNQELYNSAQLALKFYNRGQYFYFVLIYIEMIALFLKMVTLLGGMFVEDILLSIYVDPITLLPNRFQLLKDVQTLDNLIILIINIKAFSKINLLHGYDIGDVLLKKVATFLKVQESIKSYRIYGDEFAILVNNEEEAQEIFQKLNESIFIKIADISYQVYFYGAYDDFKKLSLEACELALVNSHKKELINTNEIKALVERYRHELTMVQKLKEIMIADNIIPYYQPIYACGNFKRVIKYEVLMRVKYKDTILEPKDFLSALLDAPFYTEFTKSMLYKAFETFKDNDCNFSLNLTTTDIKDKGVKLFLETLIVKYPQTATRLTIEILETEALSEFELINEFILYLRKHGIKFALDDFGSGFSNFAQIAKLDIDFIKIDASIIKEITNDEKMQKLLDAILSFAQSMQIRTIAEFVYNEEIFDYLKEKVTMMQGYHIGKPEPMLLPQNNPFI